MNMWQYLFTSYSFILGFLAVYILEISPSKFVRKYWAEDIDINTLGHIHYKLEHYTATDSGTVWCFYL